MAKVWLLQTIKYSDCAQNTLGYAHLVLVPLLILACHQDIRRGIGKAGEYLFQRVVGK